MARARVGRGGRSFVVAALAVAGSACSLLTSLNGLTGGSPAGDGGTDALPGSDDSGLSSDAPLATDSASDAGSEDGGADALAPIDAGDGGVQLFYDDFDEPPVDPGDAAALRAPWDHVSGLGAGASRNGSLFVSAPYAMLVQTEAGAPEVDCAGYKTFGDAGTTGTYALSFWVYVQYEDDTADSDAVLTAFQLIDGAGTRWALQLEVSYVAGTGLTVNFSENGTASDGGSLPYVSNPASRPLPLDTWTLVTMQVDVTDPDGPLAAAGANTGTLTFGSKVVATAPLSVATVNGVPEILVGITYAEQSSKAWTVFYDNVSLTYR